MQEDILGGCVCGIQHTFRAKHPKICGIKLTPSPVCHWALPAPRWLHLEPQQLGSGLPSHGSGSGHSQQDSCACPPCCVPADPGLPGSAAAANPDLGERTFLTYLMMKARSSGCPLSRTSPEGQEEPQGRAHGILWGHLRNCGHPSTKSSHGFCWLSWLREGLPINSHHPNTLVLQAG